MTDALRPVSSLLVALLAEVAALSILLLPVLLVFLFPHKPERPRFGPLWEWDEDEE